MVNDLGVDPNDWFENPLDRMPIATDKPIEYDNKSVSYTHLTLPTKA